MRLSVTFIASQYFPPETQLTLAPLFCQSLTPLFLPARPRARTPPPDRCVSIPPIFFPFVFFPPLFYFFRFSVTASEPSRPVGAEIVEIDRPFQRCAVPRVLPREIQLNTPPSHFRSHANVTRIETWFFRPLVHRGREEKKRVTLIFIERNAFLWRVPRAIVFLPRFTAV